MWCPNCGTKLDDGAKFCPNCGTKVQNDIIKPVSENRMEPESEWDGQVEDENAAMMQQLTGGLGGLF